MKLVRASGTLGLAILAILAIFASSVALADDPSWDTTGWYVGLNIGKSKAKIDDAKIANSLLDGGFTTTSISDDDRATGYKLFGGYQFNPNFALEGGYFNLGKFGFTANTLPPGTLRGETKMSGLNFDAIGILPFTQKFSGFGRIGVEYARAVDNFTATGLVTPLNSNPSKNGFNYKFGVGLQYDFTQTIGMRAEVERYRVADAVGNKGSIDLLSLGLVIRFGGNSSESKPLAAAPEPVEMPAPTPALVIVPVVASQQYCSILDIQFDINQKDILSVEKEKMSVVGTFMNKYPGTTAVIEGHSDNIGTSLDNMKLSQARAQSVVDYLVDNSHIDRSRLTAVGYGDTRPVADNDTSAGKRMNRRIDAVIACAPDVPGLTVVPARVTMAMLIDFDENKANVRPQYHDELGKVAEFLKANPTVTATVEGHTANLQTTPDQRMRMSQLRAQNVVNYLVDNFGVDRSRLTAEGYGDTRRFAYNTSLEGQQQNSRVNIILDYHNHIANKSSSLLH